MPNLNHRGPDGEGPKTGRKLGKCRKTDEELKTSGEIGKGMGNHRHNPDIIGQGKGKRINYYKNK